MQFLLRIYTYIPVFIELTFASTQLQNTIRFAYLSLIAAKLVASMPVTWQPITRQLWCFLAVIATLVLVQNGCNGRYLLDEKVIVCGHTVLDLVLCLKLKCFQSPLQPGTGNNRFDASLLPVTFLSTMTLCWIAMHCSIARGKNIEKRLSTEESTMPKKYCDECLSINSLSILFPRGTCMAYWI